MKALGKKIKDNWGYIFVFAAPWILMIFHSFIRSSWLSGEGGLLNGDNGVQLFPLMVEFWNKVHSGESLFYSWNAGCGIDFYLNMAYYLVSPFNLIVLLLPKAWIETTVQFVMVLKWSLMGVGVTYYFMHTRYNRLTSHKKLVSAVLGLAFVFSSAILMIFGYFNWTDVILLFPFILLSLEKLMEQGKWKGYYLLLTIAMLCNFYMAYQVCIFLVFWFVIHLNSEIDNKGKKFLVFAGSSVLAAASSLIIILPTAMASGQRVGAGTMTTWINDLFSIGERLFLCSNGLTLWENTTPNMFFSTGFFICTMLYFVVKLSKIEKLKVSLVWLFMMVSLCSKALTMFWHGFSIPYGVYHRFLYILIFLMLFMALQVLCELPTLNYRRFLPVAILEIVYLVACFTHIAEFQDFYGYFITFLLAVLYNLLIFFFIKGSIKYDKLLLTFSLMIILELSANAWYEFQEYDIKNWDDTPLNQSVEQIVDDFHPALDERTTLLGVTMNAGLVHDLPSPNQFVSYNSGEMIKFYEYMGLAFTTLSNYTLQGTSPLLNLMFNLRYGVSTWEGCFSDATLIAENDEVGLYEMSRLAGLGYMVSKDVLSWSPKDIYTFDLQNDFVKKAVDGDDIFETYIPEVRFTDGMLDYKHDDVMFKDGYFFYEYISKKEKELEVTEFSFTVDEDMDLYLDLFSSAPMRTVICTEDGIQYSDTNMHYQNYYHIGQVKKGQQIVIYNKHSLEAGKVAFLWFRLAKFNEDNYAKAYEKLSKNVYQIDEMEETYISGTIHADEDGIMMTSVPAMDGFTVYVDGDKTECNAVGNVFIGVPLTAGDHTVEFRYRTPYFVAGMIGSIIGFVLFGILCLIGKMSKKMPNGEEEISEQVMGEA